MRQMLNLSARFIALNLFLLLLTLTSNIHSVSIKDTKISQTRHPIKNSVCSLFKKSFTQEERQKSLHSDYQYKCLTEEQIPQRISSDNLNELNSSLIQITIGHVLMLSIMVVSLPLMFCSCMWPEKYPKWKWLRNVIYNRNRMPNDFRISSAIAGGLCLIIIIGSIMGLSKGIDIVDQYKNVGCKKAEFFDDILNGKMPSKQSGKFFVGLKGIQSEINEFANNKISMFYQLGSNALSTANQVRLRQNNVKDSIKNVYDNYINIRYIGGFTVDNGITHNTVLSTFKQQYFGPRSNKSSILGNLHYKLSLIFSQTNLALDNLISSWSFLSSKTQSTLLQQIKTTNDSINTLIAEIQKYMNLIASEYYDPQGYESLENTLKAYYWIVLISAIIGLVAAVYLVLCRVKNARYFLYFGCGILSIFSLVGFCFMTYLSFYHPQITDVCHYADQKLITENGTKELLTYMGYKQLADGIQSCMNNGDGKILSRINPSFSESLDNINIITHGTLLFNNKTTSYTQENINKPFIESINTLSKFSNAQLFDINDTYAKNHVSNIVNKYYSPNSYCNKSNVLSDSWTPSFQLLACPMDSSHMSPCTNLFNFTTCPPGCYQMLNTFTGLEGDKNFNITLAQRYGSTKCNYYDFIYRVYTNWIKPRKNRMETTKDKVNNIKTVVKDYTKKVDSVKASLNTFQTSLETNFDSMTNLKSGSFNGMDCKIISQTIWEFRDSVCIGLRQSIMYNIIRLGLICYSVLVMAFFATLAGIRNYFQNKKTLVGDAPSIAQQNYEDFEMEQMEQIQ